ncbi:MAG: transcription termination/antitermination protein NusG, partial [Oscillospiraceae bacterium]|nr:transcription termination/antitermination protein NusG [Oscillospiraceae bacterium]
MPEIDWYVVHTYSGYENKVAKNLEKMVENRRLQDLILEVQVPTETVVEIKDNMRKETEKKIFPGYVLVKMVMNDETWYVVRNIHGVTGFVGTSSKPIPLTRREIESLGVEKKVVKVDFEVGENIRVVEGPLAGFIGLVEEI